MWCRGEALRMPMITDHSGAEFYMTVDCEILYSCVRVTRAFFLPKIFVGYIPTQYARK